MIAAIEVTTLSNALENAHFAGVQIIAYDRLIRDSAHVSHSATFDNVKVGVQQASSLVSGLKERFGDGSWNVELFGGPPDDNNAYFFYNGAMSVLQPLIDSGSFKIVSGQMGVDQVGTLCWDGAVAQARMDNLCRRMTRKCPSMACCRPMTGGPSASCRRSRAFGYNSGDMPMP